MPNFFDIAEDITDIILSNKLQFYKEGMIMQFAQFGKSLNTKAVRYFLMNLKNLKDSSLELQFILG